MTQPEAWIIYAESPGEAPRPTDDATFPWAWDEVIAVLPGDATGSERAAALGAVAQATHFLSGDRSDILQFADRSSYFSGQARDNYIDALHPYISISPARKVTYVEPVGGQHRGQIRYEIIPASEL